MNDSSFVQHGFRTSRVKLGHGGCASVWLGKAPCGTLCAVKRKFNHRQEQPTGFSPNPVARIPEEELHEANIMQHIGEHENIVRVLGFYEGNQFTYCLLELMESDLGRELKANNVVDTVDSLRCIMRQVLCALSKTHAAGIAHRDLKPGNLLLHSTSEGFGGVRVALSDFGVAHGVDARDRPGLQYRGTRAFQCPEALMGRLRLEASRSADMWACGCLMVELVTGKHMFAGESAMGVLKSIFETLGSSFQDYPRQAPLSSSRFAAMLESAKFQVPAAALDLLSSFLTLDPDRRITAQQALEHSFFREPIQTPLCTWKITQRQNVSDSSRVDFLDVSIDDRCDGSSGSIHMSVQKGDTHHHSGMSTDGRATTVAAGGRFTLSNMRTNALFSDFSTTAKKDIASCPHTTPSRAIFGASNHVSPSTQQRPKRLMFDATPQPSPERPSCPGINLDDAVLLDTTLEA